MFSPAACDPTIFFEDETSPKPQRMLLRHTGRHHFFNHRCNVIGNTPDVNRILS
jgi:hypothetical protein